MFVCTVNLVLSKGFIHGSRGSSSGPQASGAQPDSPYIHSCDKRRRGEASFWHFHSEMCHPGLGLPTHRNSHLCMCHPCFSQSAQQLPLVLAPSKAQAVSFWQWLPPASHRVRPTLCRVPRPHQGWKKPYFCGASRGNSCPQIAPKGDVMTLPWSDIITLPELHGNTPAFGQTLW